MKNLFFSAIVGTTVLLSGCTYNDIYEPWFDEDQPLYEEDLRPSLMKEEAQPTPIPETKASELPPAPTPATSPVPATDNSDEPELELIDTTLIPASEKVKDGKGIETVKASEEKYVEIPLMVVNDNAPSLPAKKPQVISGTSVSFMSAHIPYAKGSSKLDAKDRANIKETITICEEYGCILKIIPHASANNRDPEQLSAKRAQVIKNAIIKSGIDDERINIEPMGALGDYSEIYIEY